jgi:hypothetical protein
VHVLVDETKAIKEIVDCLFLVNGQISSVDVSNIAHVLHRAVVLDRTFLNSAFVHRTVVRLV